MKKFCPDGWVLITVIVLQREYLSQNNDTWVIFYNVEISIYLYREIAICQRRLAVRKDRRKRGKKSASGTINIQITIDSLSRVKKKSCSYKKLLHHSKQILQKPRHIDWHLCQAPAIRQAKAPIRSKSNQHVRCLPYYNTKKMK